MHSKPKFEFRDYPPAKVAKIANFEMGETKLSQVSQASQWGVPETNFFRTLENAPCSKCPWCRENSWTHYPELPLWCSWHFDHLGGDSQQCRGWREGEILHPDRIGSNRSRDLPPTQEETGINATCFQCHHFKPSCGPNPGQGWGRCLKRNKGRFGCATACAAALTGSQK